MKILILILLFFNVSFTEIIRIPFGIINTEKESESYSLISKLVYNRLYINFTVGNPPQKIKIFLRKDSFALNIFRENFNRNLSQTFEYNRLLQTFFLDIYYTGYFSEDILKFGNFDNNNNKKLNFVLTVSDDNTLGALGLKIPHNFPEGLSSFIDTLKNNSIISSSTWTLKYYKNKKLIESINDLNNPIGELIIGGDPHDYEENKSLYPIDKYNFQGAPIHSYKYYWDLKFKSIYIIVDEEKLEIINNNSYRKDEINLKAEYSVIWGPQVYQDIILSYFFKKYEYIKNNICQITKIAQKTNLKYIECINDKNLFDLKKFPPIYFESFEFNKVFELTYEDLFVLDKETDKYIFLIVFPTNYVETIWSLGIPFLRKYQFTFDENKKVIGYYNVNNGKEENNQSKNSNSILYIIFGGLFLIFCGLLLYIGMIIHKCFYGEKRRKKANELDDDYDYDIKEIINSDKNLSENNKNVN